MVVKYILDGADVRKIYSIYDLLYVKVAKLITEGRWKDTRCAGSS